MHFTKQLSHLNASVSSAQKAAQFALKYREMDEDLHSCILEQLERVSRGHFISIQLPARLFVHVPRAPYVLSFDDLMLLSCRLSNWRDCCCRRNLM